MSSIGTISELASEGKTVLLRLDLNSPIDPASNQILDDKRFREHLPTIKELEESRVVIITHQSRPGKKDFSTLEGHAEKLAHLLGRPVGYVDDIFGRSAREAVVSLRTGEVLMLENVRFNAEENLTLSSEAAKGTHIARRLAAMGDVFVNDAFGTAHRSQPTVVGLPMLMRSAGGLLMEREVTNLSRVFTGAPRPVTFVLGGTKVDDSIAVAANVLENGVADQVIVIGVVANVFLTAAGYDIGTPSADLIAQLKYTGEVAKAKALLNRFGDRILFPDQVAVREGGERAEYSIEAIPAEAPVMDIGADALQTVNEAISSSGTVVVNGPAGVFEDPAFSAGTFEILRASSKVPFSVVGGGHTAAVIEQMGLDSAFTHISTGGGACIEFLTGKKLPAIAALERSREIFG
ncbi:phosphoglycerate kinase [Methanofollis aquaemaris]|uniref:Phosphoglycerate kinase n=1 Tax=Methanofollis aquaemaris TaxID=126734 RepID=A0A8A3S698_9EURY|nr:phosphoglycerate kinase [Methanofollis aquaemaris]QSZ67655.1 phosphoglycerate kinase [Methanofollis aquaemaris]